MPESLKCEQDKDRNELFRFIPFGICVALVLILLYIFGLAPTRKYELVDPDCLAGALPIALFTDFESALFWWGIIISPVLLIATLIALQWSTRPIFSLSKDGPFLVCFVFVLQILILTYYHAGRPDHHSLLIFLFVLSIGFALRMILRPISTRLCYIAGAIGALSVWISVESMVPVSITIGVLGLLWLLEDGDFLDKSLHYTLALFAVIGLSLVLERGWHGLLAEEYDRLSIVHLSVFGFITVLWIMIYVSNRYTQFFRQRANRFSSILVGVAMLALAMLVSFPKFYNGPFADVDPRLIPIWLNKISELQPLISISGSLVMPVQLLGSAVICFPFLFYLLLWNRHSESWKGWVFISLSSVAFILISLYQIRWSIYPQVLLSIPMAGLMVLMRQRGPKTGFLKTLKNVFIVLIFSAGLLLLGYLADVIFKNGDSAKSQQKDSAKSQQGASLIQICDYLAQAEEWDGQDLLILTHIDFGAEILYRTEHKVLSTPHATGTPHRNGQGIWDTYEIMTADTDEKAHELIQRRRIDLILLCPKSTESAFYSKPELTSTFYQRLLQDRIPNWLRKMELPSDLSSSFLLFQAIE